MSIIDGGNAFTTVWDDPGTGTPEVPEPPVPEIPTPGNYAPSTRTVADVIRQVKRQFGDESGVQIDDADIVAWINDAQEAINAANKVLKSTASVDSIKNQPNYTFPPLQIHQIESLHYAGARLSNMPFTSYEEMSPDPDSSGEPEFWVEWGGRFTLWPKPSTVEKITIYFTVRPAKVSLPTDLLTLPDKYYGAIVDYALKKAYELDEDWAASQAKGEEFKAAVNDMGEEERTAQNMTYSTITIY